MQQGVQLASFVRGLGPAAWFRFNTGITVTGAGVSTWADQSGNGRDLLQGTDANRPALQADGSILFDGSTDVLQCGAFTFAQPETVYILFKQATWTLNDAIFDGNTANSMKAFQSAITPEVRITAAAATPVNGNLPVDSYGVLVCVFDGASSLTQVNFTSPVSGNVGVGDAGGFKLGASASGNVQVKEVILYAAAHDAATRARVIRYLAQVGGLSV